MKTFKQFVTEDIVPFPKQAPAKEGGGGGSGKVIRFPKQATAKEVHAAFRHAIKKHGLSTVNRYTDKPSAGAKGIGKNASKPSNKRNVARITIPDTRSKSSHPSVNPHEITKSIHDHLHSKGLKAKVSVTTHQHPFMPSINVVTMRSKKVPFVREELVFEELINEQ